PTAALLMSTPAYRWSQQAYQPTLAALGEIAARLSYRLGAPLYAPWRTDAESKMAQMSAMGEEQIAAVLAAPWMARLACVDRDGAPHVVPVWHEWDRDRRTFHILAWRGSRWADYLLDNPQVSLTVDEPWPPLRRVSARGAAAPLYEANDPQLWRLLARLSRRYLGRNVAETLTPQVERSFVITPHIVRGWQGLPAEKEGAQ
ncbi:MAG: pyridoxamine 5'-phosphate oxidase family protein, partial [Caldilinea sp.]|nr:pyridoxamine 5'-phosphate oxidase family protein [Caldilinea sp.]